MSFSRKALTLALAGMVGAGFTGAAIADNGLQGGLTPNSPPQAYSSEGSSPGPSTTPSDSQGATADRANRATSPANAPADRLPANRGQSGDNGSQANGVSSSDASNLNRAGNQDNANNPNALYEGNEKSRAVTEQMSGRYNASELNAQSQPGTTGAVNPNDAEHAPTRGNLTSPSGTSESSATGAASTDDAEHAPTAGGTDANRQPVEVYHRQTSIYVVPNDPNQDATVAHTQQSWSAPGGTEPSAQSTGAQSSAASPSQSRTRALDQGNVAPGQAGIGARDYNSGGSMSESGTSTSGAAPGTGSATDNSPSSTSTQSQSTDQRFDALIHNDVLSPDSVIGPAGGLREGNDLGNASGVSPGGDRMHSGSSSSMGSSSGMSRSSTSTGNSGNM